MSSRPKETFADRSATAAESLPMIEAICNEISKSEFYHNMMEDVHNLLMDPSVTADALEDQIRNVIAANGHKEKLRSSVYLALSKFPSYKNKVPQKKECLEYVQKTQTTWEQRISKSLNNMSNDLGIPFARKRPVSEQIEFELKWSELGSEDMDLSRFRPVYSPKDFLEVLVNMKNSNVSSPPTPDMGSPTYWGLVKVPLNVKTFHELKLKFEEFSGNIDHLGINIISSSSPEYSKKYLNERVALGRHILEEKQAILAREFCKRGCPVTLRADLWSLMLGVEIAGSHRLNFKHLKSCVFNYDLLIDKLIFKDIHLTASNDDQYFVFEDLLYQILLVFSRDTSILWHFENSSSSPSKAMLRNSHSSVPYPPNGVIPFHGFSMLVAPLCYIYEDPTTLYYIFREFYVRYFFRLHNVSSHEQGALSLALLFESILDEMEPQLAYHFHKHDIQPLKIAMKWIVKAFSGSLAVTEILQLWDCMLAYDATEILVVLAVGIFSFRRSVLMQAENQATVENILADISNVKVIPILHGMLVSSHQLMRHAPSTSR